MGTSALGCACTNDGAHSELVKFLLGARADVNHQSVPRTKEARKSVRDAQDVVRSWTFNALQFDLSFYDGCSALMWAVQRGKVAEVQALVDARADLSLRNGMGQTAFQVAERYFGT